MSSFTKIRLLPRNLFTGWEAERSASSSNIWMGGLTRERVLVRHSCNVEPWTPPPLNLPLPTSVFTRQQNRLTRQDWAQRCALAREGLKGPCQKVVLARATDFYLKAPVSEPNNVLLHTLTSAMQQPGCSSLWMTHNDSSHWIATTPEMLFTREGSLLQTEALAGTLRAQGTDEELKYSLLSCPRRVQEVETTAVGILESLRQLGIYSTIRGELTMRRYRDWAHLCIPIQADCTGVNDEELLYALHPSPAVCGFPRAASGPLRRSIEGPTEGWYAGACGISTPDWACFVVVLRCAEVLENKLTAWSGVGLVDGFDEECEWNELELKLASWRRFL